MKNKKPIYVTQPTLPPLAELMPYFEQIWRTKTLTNAGPFHQQFEQALCDYLGVEHVSLFANGTLALVTAFQALELTGEVITTPYSFVASSNSLLWNNLTPVFVDIDPNSLNLDPNKIEAAITEQTSAILPVHVYGHPCDVDAIEGLAQRYDLKVIYDAAHAFGVQCHCGSVMNHGDLSILSFHATKVFNTFEGGAIVSPDAQTKQHVDHLKNFGFVDETTVVASGINSKMSELHAVVGLQQLKYVDESIAKRQKIDANYRKQLSNIPGITCVGDAGEVRANYAYFPILVGSAFGLSRDALFEKLRAGQVIARRYFYPLISDFPMYQSLSSANDENLPTARRTADSVICLPIYPDLSAADQQRVIDIIVEEVGHGLP